LRTRAGFKEADRRSKLVDLAALDDFDRVTGGTAEGLSMGSVRAVDRNGASVIRGHAVAWEGESLTECAVREAEDVLPGGLRRHGDAGHGV
jgi:hypothetical protein